MNLGARFALLGLLIFALGGAACAGRPESRATGLLDILRRHHDSLRWENYGAAVTQVDPGFRESWGQQTTALGRITEYEIGGIDLKDPPGDDAAVLVRLTGFRAPDMTVHSVVVRERWRRNGDHWRLTEMVPAQQTQPY